MVVLAQERRSHAGSCEGLPDVRRRVPGAVPAGGVLFAAVCWTAQAQTAKAVEDVRCLWSRVSTKGRRAKTVLSLLCGDGDARAQAVNHAAINGHGVTRSRRQSEVFQGRERAVVVPRRTERVTNSGLHQELRAVSASSVAIDLPSHTVLLLTMRDSGCDSSRTSRSVWREVAPMERRSNW